MPVGAEWSHEFVAMARPRRKLLAGKIEPDALEPHVAIAPRQSPDEAQ